MNSQLWENSGFVTFWLISVYISIITHLFYLSFYLCLIIYHFILILVLFALFIYLFTYYMCLLKYYRSTIIWPFYSILCRLQLTMIPYTFIDNIHSLITEYTQLTVFNIRWSHTVSQLLRLLDEWRFLSSVSQLFTYGSKASSQTLCVSTHDRSRVMAVIR